MLSIFGAVGQKGRCEKSMELDEEDDDHGCKVQQL